MAEMNDNPLWVNTTLEDRAALQLLAYFMTHSKITAEDVTTYGYNAEEQIRAAWKLARLFLKERS